MYEARHNECTDMGTGKSEPYQTEEQALSSPYYGSVNRERITQINPNWSLYSDEGTIKTLYNAR